MAKRKSLKEIIRELKELEQKGGTFYSVGRYTAWKLACSTRGRARVFRNKRKELERKKVRIKGY